MRYTLAEEAWLAGIFNAGDTVTISLRNLATDAAVPLTAGTCAAMTVFTNVFRWHSSDIVTQPTTYTEYVWRMTNGTIEQTGVLKLGGYPGDMQMISGDSAAADNLEATYDGTGYEDPFAPAQQQQLDQIALTGAAINETADSAVLTTGSTVTGDYTDTFAVDQVYWQITDAAGALDMYFEFVIPADGVPTSMTFTGKLNSANDTLLVYAYNWGSTSWEQIGTLTGQGGAGDTKSAYDLFTSHVGTGADLGKIRIRFANTGLTSANFYADQIFISYAVITRSVGYAMGGIWIDTVNGTAGTERYINGTADNPVNTWADALTLSGSVGLTKFFVSGSITIGASDDISGMTFVDNGGHATVIFTSGCTTLYTDISGDHMHISGALNGHVHVEAAHLASATTGIEGFFKEAIFEHGVTYTLGGSNTIRFINCTSSGTPGGTATFDAGGSGRTLVVLGQKGDMTLTNKTGADVFDIGLDGGVLTVASSCTAGTVNVRGNGTLIDNSGPGCTVVADDLITRSAGYSGGSIWIDTVNGAAGTVPYFNGTSDNPVDSWADALSLSGATNIQRFVVAGVITVGAPDDISNMSFFDGGGHATVIITSGATTLNSNFNGGHMHLSGDLGGHVHVDGSHLDATTTGLEGFFRECLLDHGITYTLGGSGTVRLVDCNSTGTPGGTVTLNAGGSGRTLSIIGHRGNLTLTNKTGAEVFDIGLLGGVLTVDATCTSGTINIKGTGALIDNSGPGCTVVADDLVTRSVGYAEGAIWIDTVNGSPGTVDFFNGTADRPVSTLADATTLSGSVGLKIFRVAPGSSLSLGQAYDGFAFLGQHWDLDLNGQSIADTIFEGANVTGTATATSEPHFASCYFGTATLPPCHAHDCSIESNLTAGSVGTYIFEKCYSAVAGTSTPQFDFGAALGNTNINFRHYSGGIELLNMGQSGTDNMSLEGDGQYILNANCVGGTLVVRGSFDKTDNSGSVTIVETARYTQEQVEDAVWDANQSAHLAPGSTGESLDDASAAAVGDWTDAEQEQMRDALGIDGSKTAATGGQLQALRAQADKLDDAATTAPASATTGSLLDRLANKDGSKTYDQSTDSLEATRERIG